MGLVLNKDDAEMYPNQVVKHYKDIETVGVFVSEDTTMYVSLITALYLIRVDAPNKIVLRKEIKDYLNKIV